MIRLFILICFAYSSLFSADILESPEQVEDANLKLILILNNLTEGQIVQEAKTKGFEYRYKSKWYSPFHFNVYLGKPKVESTNSIIRVEAPKRGEEKILKAWIEKELSAQTELNKEEKKINEEQKEAEKLLTPKSHALAQTLNLISPSAAIFYCSYDSPTYTFRDTMMGMSIYTFWDILLLSFGAFYVNNTVRPKNLQGDLLNKKGPRYGILNSKIAPVILLGMASTRIYRAWGTYEDIGVHNRMVELSYTYKF